MAPQTPLLLIDNVFDTVQQYTAGLLSADSFRVGHDPFRVADYRRERTSWQVPAAGAGHQLKVDLGLGVARSVDSLFIDRGHNLWGAHVSVFRSSDGVTYTSEYGLTVPALGTLGGSPTAGFSVTEEGALYFLASGPSSAYRYWMFSVDTSMAPVVSGLILGMKNQLLGYSSTFDEDAGERTEVSATSTAGYRGTDNTYSWRTLDLGLSFIGVTEYDATISALRELLFKKNQPAVIAMDYGTRPERAWMYQFEGRTWGMAKKRVYRDGRMRFREVGASLS